MSDNIWGNEKVDASAKESLNQPMELNLLNKDFKPSINNFFLENGNLGGTTLYVPNAWT